MEDKDNNLWEKIKKKIREKIDSHSFQTWFEPTQYIGRDENTLFIKVPNSYFKEWLTLHYSLLIQRTIEELTGEKLDFRYIFEEEAKFQRKDPIKRRKEAGSLIHPNLNPNYTFENFVVGSCNQFAHAASLAVAENPAKAYNPFYIYGGVGLGKTHLMNAIGHYILKKSPSVKLLYITTEKFMNELINYLQHGKILEFRKKYRSVDILLIDDIQFLSGRERTKEEFFHTFNHLYDAQKQIVISSDCPPREIPNLEERLLSRFEWGLIADLKPPDLETRIAILYKKAELENVKLPEDVALYIANKIHSNIRELEGCLRRVIAYASLKGTKICLDLAKEALRNILPEEEKLITIEKIQKFISQKFKLKISDLKSKNNSPHIAFPRQIAMYLARELTNASLPE
ncbi:chromosomal replication initiator protein DnaA, partial [Candidatus Aminicenantes bacterium AC-335-L06]|nr:chromosomal replication initiator protein DnaA [Candidatus Aminicenantes bacterium AC-335-L06]